MPPNSDQEPAQCTDQRVVTLADVTEPSRTDDVGYLTGVTDLLGLLAYAELVAFFRLSEDAALAPTIADKAALAQMAVAEFGHFQLVRDRLVRLGADPELAMRPFMGPLDEFHAKTVPSSWPEGLVKAYVGDGVARDFYRVIAEFLDAETRALVLEVMADTAYAEFAVDRVRAAIESDPPLASRLALWARRLVGEALGQAQRVAAEREPLARLIAGRIAAAQPESGGDPADARRGGAPAEARRGSDLGDIGRIFARLTDQNTGRMAALGMDV